MAKNHSWRTGAPRSATNYGRIGKPLRAQASWRGALFVIGVILQIFINPMDKLLNTETYFGIFNQLWKQSTLHKIVAILLIPVFSFIYILLSIPYVLLQLTRVVNKNVKNPLLRLIIIVYVWCTPIFIVLKYEHNTNNYDASSQTIPLTNDEVIENSTNQTTPSSASDGVVESENPTSMVVIKSSTPIPILTSTPTPVSYDHNLGSSSIAAQYAKKLLTATAAVGPDFIRSIFVEVSPENINSESVTSVFIQVKINSAIWVTTNSESKKDFVVSWLTSAKKEFPKAFPHVYISNEYRRVAEGELTLFGEPKIILK